MGRKIDRRTVVVDGREMVAVRPADFERLDASRRQVGARTARSVRIYQQLRDANAKLARIRVILAAGDSAQCVCGQVAAVLDDKVIQGSGPHLLTS